MPWASAKVHGVVVAETEFPQCVGGDVYFPPECVKWEYLSASNPPVIRKGTPIYYTLSVGGTVIPDAAWSHPDPANKKLMGVKNFVAFHGMAPVMIRYKKNFRYARAEDSRSDTSSIHTTGSSTPSNSMPTTPTLGYATPAPAPPSVPVPSITFTYTYNPSIYDYRSLPPPPRLGMHCSATAMWRDKKLPNIPEVEVCGLEVCED